MPRQGLEWTGSTWQATNVVAWRSKDWLGETVQARQPFAEQGEDWMRPARQGKAVAARPCWS